MLKEDSVQELKKRPVGDNSDDLPTGKTCMMMVCSIQFIFTNKNVNMCILQNLWNAQFIYLYLPKVTYFHLTKSNLNLI